MAWETESKSKMTGTVDTDATIGGGSQNYSGDAETLAIEARGETWYVGAENKSSPSASDFFIGLSSLGKSFTRLPCNNPDSFFDSIITSIGSSLMGSSVFFCNAS